MTRVKGNYQGDAYFPQINLSEWKETNRKDLEDCSFIDYHRTHWHA